MLVIDLYLSHSDANLISITRSGEQLHHPEGGPGYDTIPLGIPVARQGEPKRAAGAYDRLRLTNYVADEHTLHLVGRVPPPDEAGGLRAREVGAAVQQVRSVHKGKCSFLLPSSAMFSAHALEHTRTALKDGDNELRGEKMQQELWPYYRGLMEKYGLGGKLKW